MLVFLLLILLTILVFCLFLSHFKWKKEKKRHEWVIKNWEDECNRIKNQFEKQQSITEHISKDLELYRNNNLSLTNQTYELDIKLNELREQYNKLLGQKKSSEVRTGHIAEVLVPFLDLFEYDPEQTRFLGNPIDYMVFSDDEVIFLEVKSGASRLSSKQNRIKKNVEEGKVRFEILRVGGKNGNKDMP